MKATIMFLVLFLIFVCPSCKNIDDEILPVGAVVIFLDTLSSQGDWVTLSLRFRELLGVHSEVACLMPKFMKDGSFMECGYFAPCVIIPRFGEISYTQRMLTANDCREADVLRIIIQLQTENFKGFSVTKDFNLNIRGWD